MDKDQDYDSSDSSDEDFCPDQAPDGSDGEVSDVGSSAGEEEEEEDVVSGSEQKSKKLGRLPKKSKTKPSKKTKSAGLVPSKEPDRRNTRQAASEMQNGRSKHEKDEIESDDDEKNKSHSDSLWADFLNDVGPKKINTIDHNKDNPSSSQKSISEKNKSSRSSTTSDDSGASSSSSVRSVQDVAPTLVTITEVLDFAGEEVRVEKTVRADCIKTKKETKPIPVVAARPSPLGLKRPMGGGGGLGSILGSIGKKKKISVLDKSKLDWVDFKQDEGIDEEIQTFNKGKDGYLEKQDFLHRTDVRQFEIERNLRQARRTN